MRAPPRRGPLRIDVIGASLESLAQRLERVGSEEGRLHVATAVAGKLYELAVNDAAGHVDTGLMLSSLDFHVLPGEVGVTLQDYKQYVNGLALRFGIPKKWRPDLQAAGQAALTELVGGAS